MTSLGFRIQQWAAWSPGAQTNAQWESWANQTDAPFPTAEWTKPDVSFVPAMLRRRLSHLSQMALHVGHRCQSSMDTPFRSIYSSRHGEIHRTVGLLTSIAHEKPVSPTQFSLSVHNTSAGLASIATNNQGPATALAAQRDPLLSACLEAYGWLHIAPTEPILIVIADEPLPAIYEPFIDEHEVAYAIALLIVHQDIPCDAPLLTATLDHTNTSPPPTNETTHHLPQPIPFMRWLLSEEETWHNHTQQMVQWSWRKRHGHQN